MHERQEGGWRAAKPGLLAVHPFSETNQSSHCRIVVPAKAPPRFAGCLCWSPVCAWGPFLLLSLWCFFLGHTVLSYIPHVTLSLCPLWRHLLPIPTSFSFPSSSHQRPPQRPSGNYRTGMWRSHFLLFLVEWLQVLLSGGESCVCPPCPTPLCGTRLTSPLVSLPRGRASGTSDSAPS